MKVTFRPIGKWPRAMTPADKRKVHPFRQAYSVEGEQWKSSRPMPLSRTYDDLRRELRHLGAHGDVVLQVAVREGDIRQDGLVRASARQPEHPGVMISFIARVGGRDVPLSFACDDCRHWEDNLRAIVRTLEHLRGADRYGVTKTGEQYRGWAALPPAIVTPAPMTVDEAAAFVAAAAAPLVGQVTDPDVRMKAKAAGAAAVLRERAVFEILYRLAARQLHPDGNGGQERPEWHRLQQAKGLLERHHAPGGGGASRVV